MQVVSFGGGVQSTALLVLAVQGELAVDAFLFSNVGNDSEHPATLRYVREVAMPYAAAHGIALHELHRTRRDGTPETLYGRLTGPRYRGVVIPARMSGGHPAKRNCTEDFKIAVINKWLREHGATARQPVTVLLGISQDEWHRANTGHTVRYMRRGYPLLSTAFAQAGLIGMLRDGGYTRADCLAVIARAGLPIPPKSSCWFCPYHRLGTWRELRASEPELFAEAVTLEAHLSAESQRRGKGPVYLTDKRKSLPMAVGEASQPSLFGGTFEDDACESGYCVA